MGFYDWSETRPSRTRVRKRKLKSGCVLYTLTFVRAREPRLGLAKTRVQEVVEDGARNSDAPPPGTAPPSAR